MIYYVNLEQPMMFSFIEIIDGITLYPRRRRLGAHLVGGWTYHMTTNPAIEGSDSDAGLLVDEASDIAIIMERLANIRRSSGMVSHIEIVPSC
jgi:hypothetical protein